MTKRAPGRASCSTSTARPRRSCSTTARASASSGCPQGARGCSIPPSRWPGLADPEGAIRHALLIRSTSDPLPALLRPGMKLTIAFDDISLPLPPMRKPDIRQRVIEAVLDMAAEAGVDDVHIIAALALHRRMTEAELRHAVGDRVYDAFAPHGLLYNHDAEDPDGMVILGETATRRGGADEPAGRRERSASSTSTSTSSLWTVDGSPRQPASRATPRSSTTTTCTPCCTVESFMDQHKSELHTSQLAPGQGLPRRGHQDLPDRDDGQQQHIRLRRADGVAAEARVGMERPRPAHVRRDADRAQGAAHAGQAQDLPVMASPYELTSVQAGEVEAVHKITTENVYRQQLVAVQGQTDILTMGLPYICPYNVNSIMNPILVMCLGLGYFFNMYRGKPLVREGGVLIMSAPHAVGVPPGAPPELHRLLRAGARRHDRPDRDRAEVREAVRRGRVVPPPLPHELRLPRRPSVLHVVLGSARAASTSVGSSSSAATHAPCVASASGRRRRCTTRSRWRPTSSGVTPTITHLHNPPIVMADVT